MIKEQQERTGEDGANPEVLKDLAIWLEGIKLGRGGNIQPLGIIVIDELWKAIRELRYIRFQTVKQHEPYFGLCDVSRCKNEGCSGGIAWRETGYWTVCSEHHDDFRAGKPQPKMKRASIKREKGRGKDGIMPNVKNNSRQRAGGGINEM